MKVKLVDVNRSPVGEKEVPNNVSFRSAIAALVRTLGGQFCNPYDKSMASFGVMLNGKEISPEEAPKLTSSSLEVTLIGYRHGD